MSDEKDRNSGAGRGVMPLAIRKAIDTERKRGRMSLNDTAALVNKLGGLRGTGVTISAHHLGSALKGEADLSWAKLDALLELFDLELTVRRKNNED